MQSKFYTLLCELYTYEKIQGNITVVETVTEPHYTFVRLHFLSFPSFSHVWFRNLYFRNFDNSYVSFSQLFVIERYEVLCEFEGLKD